jgi:hypothetical protein
LLDLLTEREGYFALGLGLAFAAATYIGALRTRGAWAGRVARGSKTAETYDPFLESTAILHEDQTFRDVDEDESRPEPGVTT